MKKLFLIFVILLYSVLLYAQNPILRFHQTDGSSISYNINEINNICFNTNNIKSDSIVLKIYYLDSLTAYYSISIIDSIQINNSEIRILINNFPKKYLLYDIDSICFFCDKYEMMTIGTQVWMTKNLDVSTYRNGDTIPQITDQSEWGNLLTGARCNFKNNFEMGIIYGKLYNWFAVNDPRGLAPIGWHIPSDEEWKILEINLGMLCPDADSSGWRGTLEGGKLKEDQSLLWESPNTGANNESGFSALPGANRYDDGGFGDIDGIFGFWWTSTSVGTWNALGRTLTYNTSCIYRGYNMKEYGFSVRCVRDK